MIEISKPIDPPKYKKGDIVCTTFGVGIILNCNQNEKGECIYNFIKIAYHYNKSSLKDRYYYTAPYFVDENKILEEVDIDRLLQLYITLLSLGDINHEKDSLRKYLNELVDKFIKIRDEIIETKNEILNYKKEIY